MERLIVTNVSIPSTFPPSRRPIHVHPEATMSHKLRTESYPIVIAAIETVCQKHPNERILVHTVSYDLNNYIYNNNRIDRPLYTYRVSSEKDRAIASYRKSENAVLLAPSLERGIDLPYDECRVIVVAKIPFPSLGDKQVNARLHSHGGNTWYAVRTIRSLVQMTGRGMRSADDYCTSYILDRQFMSHVWKRKHLLPKWWADALNFSAGPLTPTLATIPDA